jgi:hypothetical protein
MAVRRRSCRGRKGAYAPDLPHLILDFRCNGYMIDGLVGWMDKVTRRSLSSCAFAATRLHISADADRDKYHELLQRREPLIEVPLLKLTRQCSLERRWTDCRRGGQTARHRQDTPPSEDTPTPDFRYRAHYVRASAQGNAPHFPVSEVKSRELRCALAPPPHQGRRN